VGKLVSKKEIIEENIQQFVERSSSNYSTLLESTPVFGIYYHQDNVFSTNDLGLENIEENIGRDSPLKFNKIENFPFYGIDSLSLNIERGDIGLNTSIESEVTILPNTIKPYPNDYFTLYSLGDKYLFKITECFEDMIKSKPFYKLTFRLSKVVELDSDHIENQVIEKYRVIPENIGTKNNCIIKLSTYQTLDYMNKLKEKLTKFFMRNFYNKEFNIILLHMNSLDMDFYNKYLNKFIIDNDLFKSTSNNFYSNYKLLEYLPTDCEFDAAYETSLYYALEIQNADQFKAEYFSYMDINYIHAPWHRNNKKYKDLILLGCNEDYKQKSDKILEFIDKKFFGRICLNNQFSSEENFFMENFIIRYIHKDNSLPSKELLDRINNNIWRKDMRSYIFIPLIIFIFNKLEEYENNNDF